MKTSIELGKGVTRSVIEISPWLMATSRGGETVIGLHVAWQPHGDSPISKLEARQIAFVLNMYADLIT